MISAMTAYTNVTSRQTDVLTVRCGTYTLAPLITRSLTTMATIAAKVICITVSTPYLRVGLKRLRL